MGNKAEDVNKIATAATVATLTGSGAATALAASLLVHGGSSAAAIAVPCVAVGAMVAFMFVTSVACIVIESKGTTYEHKVLEFQNIIAPGEYNKIVDERLRFVTAIAALEIRRMCDSSTNSTNITWEQLEKVMNECIMLEKSDDSTVNKFESKTFSEIKDASDKVGYLKEWIRNLVLQADSDVYDAMRLTDDDLDSVLRLVLKDTGIHDGWTFFVNSHDIERDLLDIGMIRFPTDDRPYVKLYRILVRVRAKNSRILFLEGGKHATTSVEFTSRKYYPRMDMFKSLSSDVVSTSISAFETALQK